MTNSSHGDSIVIQILAASYVHNLILSSDIDRQLKALFRIFRLSFSSFPYALIKIIIKPDNQSMSLAQLGYKREFQDYPCRIIVFLYWVFQLVN